MSNSSLMPSMAPMTLAPTFAPSAIGVDQGDVLTGILNLILLTLVIFTCIGLCCSENRGYLAADQFHNNELDPVALRRNMAHSKWGVLRLKRETLSQSSFWCCFSKDSVVPAHDTALVLFFPARLKFVWKPTLAILQFVLGWIAIISTIVGVIVPSNQANKTLGSAALFLGEIILQVWYGYLRYPNLMSCILRQGDDDDGLFDSMRHIFGLAYHNGRMTKFPNWIDGLCFILILPFHIGALFGCVASFILFSVIGSDNGRRRGDDGVENAYISAFLGALFGSITYPLYFWSATTGGEILAISLAHHVVQEYFEAKLFNKGAKSFFMAVFCKFFSEIIGVDEAIDVNVETNEAVVNNYNKPQQDIEMKGNEQSENQAEQVSSIPPDPEEDVDPEEGVEERKPRDDASDCSSHEASSEENIDGPYYDKNDESLSMELGHNSDSKASKDQ